MDKTAKEMFEELGYRYKECKHPYYENSAKGILKDSILCEKDYNNEILTVLFNLEDKKYVVNTLSRRGMFIEHRLHLAIHQQAKESGWLNP